MLMLRYGTNDERNFELDFELEQNKNFLRLGYCSKIRTLSLKTIFWFLCKNECKLKGIPILAHKRLPQLFESQGNLHGTLELHS